MHRYSGTELFGRAEEWLEPGLQACSGCTGGEADLSARKNTLRHVQAATFLAIVIVQWGGLLACRTRVLSLFQFGFRNKVAWAALFSMAFVASVIIYVPGVQTVLGTKPLWLIEWLPALPTAVFIWIYDECRKSLLRRSPEGFVARVSGY